MAIKVAWNGALETSRVGLAAFFHCSKLSKRETLWVQRMPRIGGYENKAKVRVCHYNGEQVAMMAGATCYDRGRPAFRKVLARRTISMGLVALAISVLECCSPANEVQPGFRASDSGVYGRLAHTVRVGSSVKMVGPAAGRVFVASGDRSTLVGSFDTDRAGDFRIPLKPGSYFIYTEGDYGQFGKHVSVSADRFTTMTLYLPPGR